MYLRNRLTENMIRISMSEMKKILVIINDLIVILLDSFTQ